MEAFLAHAQPGPSDSTKATLGCAFAAVVSHQKHKLTVAFAGAGVHNLGTDAYEILTGLGDENLGAWLSETVKHDDQFRASDMSAKERGYDKTDLEGLSVASAMPDDLVDLAEAAETALYY